MGGFTMDKRAASSESWRTSSYCDAGGCIAVARESRKYIIIRDNTDAKGPRLAFSLAEWKEFIRQIRSDES